jgi:hypothetical protein
MGAGVLVMPAEDDCVLTGTLLKLLMRGEIPGLPRQRFLGELRRGQLADLVMSRSEHLI